MMKHRHALFILPALVMILITLAGCRSGQNEEITRESSDPFNEAEPIAFSYSEGIDDKGYWEGITALDHVELFDYKTLTIPDTVHIIPDETVQYEINNILAGYRERKVMDRAVVDGDTVNIDYVGSVDGVEFAGGSTGGAGTDVIIGVTGYIDDFLEQLIGHAPGETIHVEVTFPEDYGVEELNGRDALFITTINYIVETVDPELNDDFVAENLLVENGWSTVEEMNEGIYAQLRNAAIQSYVQEYLMDNATVLSLPDELLSYMENSLISYYQDGADYYGVGIEEFLIGYVGVSTVDELLELYHDNNVEQASYTLVIQAVAEDAGITVNETDVSDYFADYVGAEDYSLYEAEYGAPYLKQGVLNQLVLDYLVNQAVLES